MKSEIKFHFFQIKYSFFFKVLFPHSYFRFLFDFIINYDMNIQENHLNTPFIRKLNTILSDPANIDIIAWDETGTLIDILDEKKIQTEILPKFFRHSKFQSFIRQLNLYGFKKMKKKNCHRFRHPDLVKGNSLFSIKSQRKFKNSSHKLSMIQKLQNQNSQNMSEPELGQEKSEEKQSFEIGKTKKIQTESFIENKLPSMYPIPYNFQNIYQNGYPQTAYNYSQAGGTFANYGFQSVYLPNFNNILFYN